MGQKSRARSLRRANRVKTDEVPRKRWLSHVEVTGYDKMMEEIAMIVCRVKSEDGSEWVTPKDVKKELARKGAVNFRRINVWKEGRA